MKRKIQISIPTPCHENWQNMTVTEKGRFCTSCQKNVIDFTKSSDREIANVFDTNKNLCGRFNAAQLNRDLIVPKEKSRIWVVAASGVLAFIGIGTTISSAQQNNTEQTDKKTLAESPESESIVHQVNGTVNDMTGLFPGVNVVIKGTDRRTQTDIDGNFSIMVQQNEILVFSNPGYISQEIIIDDKNSYNVKMEDFVTGDVVIKRTFFGHIFHSIGNLFR